MSKTVNYKTFKWVTIFAIIISTFWSLEVNGITFEDSSVLISFSLTWILVFFLTFFTWFAGWLLIWFATKDD